MKENIDKWLCSSCQTLLGFVEDKKTVRMKRKDLYVSCTGGTVEVTCTKCGKLNRLVDKKEIDNLVDLQESVNG